MEHQELEVVVEVLVLLVIQTVFKVDQVHIQLQDPVVVVLMVVAVVHLQAMILSVLELELEVHLPLEQVQELQ
jgi:hypothetical protein